MKKLSKILLSIIAMQIVILIVHFTKWHFVKFYPVVINFMLFLMFFVSSFAKETVIQKFAKLTEPNIKLKAFEYTRKLTYVWAGFTFLNFLVSFITVFLSQKVWALYNGFISYMLVGSFFAIEYIIRVRFKKKYDC